MTNDAINSYRYVFIYSRQSFFFHWVQMMLGTVILTLYNITNTHEQEPVFFLRYGSRLLAQ